MLLSKAQISSTIPALAVTLPLAACSPSEEVVADTFADQSLELNDGPSKFIHDFLLPGMDLSELTQVASLRAEGARIDAWGDTVEFNGFRTTGTDRPVIAQITNEGYITFWKGEDTALEQCGWAKSCLVVKCEGMKVTVRNSEGKENVINQGTGESQCEFFSLDNGLVAAYVTTMESGQLAYLDRQTWVDFTLASK